MSVTVTRRDSAEIGKFHDDVAPGRLALGLPRGLHLRPEIACLRMRPEIACLRMRQTFLRSVS